MNFIINLEKDDLIEDLKVALDQLSEMGYDLDSITVNSHRESTNKNPMPNVTTIYNDPHLSHNGGLRP